MNRPLPYRPVAGRPPANRPVPYRRDVTANPVGAPPWVGQSWATTEFDTVFGGPCSSGRCSAFYCVCGVPVAALARVVAWIMGLHHAGRDGSCSCGCALWLRCPHVLALRDLVTAARNARSVELSEPTAPHPRP